jgi:DNA-binding response OmpR family regulator
MGKMSSPARIAIPRPRRILIIDDSPLVVEAVGDALAHDGVSVVGLDELTDLEKARALDEFDLVLLDVHMPKAFVDEVALVMRRRSHMSAPILLLSSLPEKELAARAQESKLDGYIQKDRGIDGLADEIRTWLGGSRPPCAQGY